MIKNNDIKIAVIGLGYVGLPLAVEFAKKYPVVGVDLSTSRVAELCNGLDKTQEIEAEKLVAVNINYTDKFDDVRDCNVYIITVPTPINKNKEPNLQPLLLASRGLGKVICRGDIVIYESTVYPGATEEDCVPVIEEMSGLKLNQDFYAGYSPERINPGDKQRRLTDILKVTSGSTPEVANFVDELYASVIQAGTYKTSSIKVAEAAKVIENTQRDVNIALVNELALIFDKLNIDTEEVLKAAGTKWNFLPFRPGLVGGHCIGVDPYYLTHKAQSVGYYPAMILAGRRVNDGMGQHVANNLVKLLLRRNLPVNGARALVMGLTFKENCPDIRDTRVINIIEELESFGMNVDVWDPWVNPVEAKAEYDISPITQPQNDTYDAIVLAVSHSQFVDMGASAIRAMGTPTAVLYDVKYLFNQNETDGRL